MVLDECDFSRSRVEGNIGKCKIPEMRVLLAALTLPGAYA
jgi:hypothetical protein